MYDKIHYKFKKNLIKKKKEKKKKARAGEFSPHLAHKLVITINQKNFSWL